MTDRPSYHHLPDDPCIAEEKMFRYIDGKLSPEQMYEVERHAVDCAFCSDAIEGLQRVSERDRVGAYLTETGTGESAAETGAKIISMTDRRPLYYAVAAGLVLITGIGIFMHNISNGSEKPNQLADNNSQKLISPLGDVTKKDSVAKVSDLEKNNSATVNTALDSLQGQPENKLARVDQYPHASGIAASGADAGGPSGRGSTVMHAEEKSTDIPAETEQSNSQNEMVLMDTQSDEQRMILEENVANDKKETEAVKAKDNDDQVAGGTSTNYKSHNDRSKQSSVANDAPSVPASNANVVTVNGTNSDSAGVANNISVVNAEVSADTVSNEQQQKYPLKESDKDIELSYGKGVQLLNAGDAAGSLVFFDDVLKYPAHYNFADAQWEKSLALIQLKRTDEAKALLNEIVKGGGKYKALAEEKLKTL
ncbi:MAG: zf-HC2 domain-containing protein [Bacteroidetes bacterium]|nr:zf-HC2 domain-containing protein [Bacteroidota bacterium]